MQGRAAAQRAPRTNLSSSSGASPSRVQAPGHVAPGPALNTRSCRQRKKNLVNFSTHELRPRIHLHTVCSSSPIKKHNHVRHPVPLGRPAAHPARVCECPPLLPSARRRRPRPPAAACALLPSLTPAARAQPPFPPPAPRAPRLQFPNPSETGFSKDGTNEVGAHFLEYLVER